MTLENSLLRLKYEVFFSIFGRNNYLNRYIKFENDLSTIKHLKVCIYVKYFIQKNCKNIFKNSKNKNKKNRGGNGHCYSYLFYPLLKARE